MVSGKTQLLDLSKSTLMLLSTLSVVGGYAGWKKGKTLENSLLEGYFLEPVGRDTDPTL